MRSLLFVSRVALICNLFFILCLILRYTSLPLPQDVKGFIIVVGYPLSIIVNLGLTAFIIFLISMRNPINIPAWLTIFNLCCILFQIAYFLLF